MATAHGGAPQGSTVSRQLRRRSAQQPSSYSSHLLATTLCCTAWTRGAREPCLHGGASICNACGARHVTRAPSAVARGMLVIADVSLETLAPYSSRAEATWRSLEAEARPTYFLTWGWIENWLACLPRDNAPPMVVVRHQDKPVAACFLA